MVSLEGKTQDSKQNGRWTDEEHQLFERALQIYGKKWKKIEAVVGTRTATQIRSHAQKHFIRLKKTSATESDCVSSASDLGTETRDLGIDPGEVEKQHLKSCIQYIHHLNSLLEAEIRKFAGAVTTQETPPTPPALSTAFSSTGSAFKRIKLEVSYDSVGNSANAPQL